MARHRAAPARAATPPPPDTPAPTAPPARATSTAVLDDRPDLGALLPRQGLSEAHPSGPLPRARSRRAATASPTASPSRHDPYTSPLDLAAIALAAAKERRSGFPATGTSPAVDAPVARTAADEPVGATRDAATTGGTPRPAFPAAVPSALAPVTPSHAVPAVGRGGRGGPRRRVALPTRTAGALALVGALAGGGVAVIGGGTMVAADRTPDTGQIAAPDLASGTAAAPAQHDARPQAAPRDHQQQGGRHRADGTGAAAAASVDTGSGSGDSAGGY